MTIFVLRRVIQGMNTSWLVRGGRGERLAGWTVLRDSDSARNRASSWETNGATEHRSGVEDLQLEYESADQPHSVCTQAHAVQRMREERAGREEQSKSYRVASNLKMTKRKRLRGAGWN